MKKLLYVCTAMLLLLLFAFSAAAEVVYMTPSETMNEQSLKMIAHRGFSALAPENTLPAYFLAGEYGFWGAECDIYHTSDGVWVLMHDTTVTRMTDGTGRVSNLTYDEISKLRIDAGTNIERFPGLTVPTLVEYLDVCKIYEMHPVIEIKKGVDINALPNLASLLDTREEKDGIIIISAERDLISAMKALVPDISMYLVVKTAAEDDIAFCLEKGIGLDAGYATSSEVFGSAQEKGVGLMAWTVDKVSTAEHMFSLGIRYITTNCIVLGKYETESGSDAVPEGTEMTENEVSKSFFQRMIDYFRSAYEMIKAVLNGDFFVFRSGAA